MEQTEPRGVEVFETAFECKDCGAVFYVGKEQQESFKAKHLELPKRCVDCRRKRHFQQHSKGGDIPQTSWDAADFERVMSKAKEEINRWRR